MQKIKFLAEWVKMAKHWAGNDTVIGFDLRNEPVAHTSTPALWGGNGPTDIHAMYQEVGNAVLAVNPNALIICESIINDKIDAYEGDFSVVKTLPIVLRRPKKLVCSVHEYPKEIDGYKGPESGAGYLDHMNKTWGWLVSQNVAPVWVGKMGSTMKTPEGRAWGDTLLSYPNGTAPGGLPVCGLPKGSRRSAAIGGAGAAARANCPTAAWSKTAPCALDRRRTSRN